MVAAVLLAFLTLPVDTARLGEGDCVYLVWQYADWPIACRVKFDKIGINRQGLTLVWDENDGGTSWTELKGCTVFSNEWAARKFAADLLQRRATDLQRRADRVRP